MKRVHIALALACLSFIGNVFAATHYVSKSGTSVPPYTTWATAADSIQKAIDISISGDTVRVGVGVYAETLVLVDGVYLLGSGMDSTMVDATTLGNTVILAADSNTIDGFCLKCNAQGNSYGILWGVVSGDSLLTVKNNKITNCGDGINAAFGTLYVSNNIILNQYEMGVYALFSCTPIVERNIIKGFASAGIYCAYCFADIRNNFIDSVTGGWGIAGRFDYRIRVENNLVTNVNHKFSHGIDIVSQAGRVVKVINNTVTGVNYNNQTGIRVAGLSNPGDSTKVIINNVATGFKVGFAYSGDTWDDPEVSYNDFWNNIINDTVESGGVGSLDSGNISLGPMFVDDEGDFHLQFASPCIDAGAPWIKDSDSSRSDIGAYGGLLGEVYVYQDLPPDIPESLEAVSDTVGITLTWKSNTESDLGGYVVYKDSVSGFPADSFHAIGIVPKDSSLFLDLNWTLNQIYYYRVSAFDTAGHISAGSPELIIIATNVKQRQEPNPELLPSTYTLYQNYPNPFNPTTTIVYYLPNIGPQPALAEISIYDILGRKVSTLVEQKQFPGKYQVAWDGKNNSGEKLGSGLYFCQLRIWGGIVSSPRKIILLK